MAIQVPLNLVSHSRRLGSVYKRALRSLEDYAYERDVYRYNACHVRQRFDKIMNIKDLRIAKQLLNDVERELFLTQHYQPRKFPKSPGGVAYDREVIFADWLADYWHPSEKAAYPYYFARREQRKKEYLEWYNKQYPDVKNNQSGHH